MFFLINGTAVLIGFILGYFFTTTVLVIITICCMFIALILRPKTEQELGAIIGIGVWIALGIGVVAMWSTHLYVNDSNLGIPNLSEYLFRKQ